MTNNKNRCIHCGTLCNHDDDGIDECRFCNASPRDSEGNPVEVVSSIAGISISIDGENTETNDVRSVDTVLNVM